MSDAKMVVAINEMLGARGSSIVTPAQRSAFIAGMVHAESVCANLGPPAHDAYHAIRNEREELSK